jgi:ATP-dependent Clp protease protease subunit
MRNNQKIRQILADATEQPMERIERDTDRDFYMSADEAQKYGLIDEVLAKPE